MIRVRELFRWLGGSSPFRSNFGIQRFLWADEVALFGINCAYPWTSFRSFENYNLRLGRNY